MALSVALCVAIACFSIVAIGACLASPLPGLNFFKSGKKENYSGSTSSEYQSVYQDEDGEALDVADSSGDRPQLGSVKTRVLIPILALFGIAASAAGFVFTQLNVGHALIVGGWGIIGLDVFFLVTTRSQPKKFQIGLIIALSAAILCAALCVVIGTMPNVQLDERPLLLFAFWAQVFTVIPLIWISCCIPRRPDVYLDGKVVDQQYTSSVIDRISFAWMWPLLSLARTTRRLEYTDLPALDHKTRSKDLQEKFPIHQLQSDSNPSGRPLWKILIADNYRTLIRQWLVGTVESIAIMIPPVFLYQILIALEKRAKKTMSTEDEMLLWFWVACMAVSKTLHVVLDQWMLWISFSSFAIPIRSQLSAAIFAKSLRMKAAEGADIKNDEDEDKDKTVDEDKVDAEETDRLIPEDKSEEDIPKPEADAEEEGSKSGIVNLLAVDVLRVSDFCGWNVDILRGTVQILVSAIVLVNLIGWWSTLAGFSVPILLNYVNRMATGRYLDSQVLAMKKRDIKAHVVTEALHGIRQIKFSASEAQWEKRILAAREKELLAQWVVYFWGIILTFAWISMPALIGATALAVFAALGGQMIASVAFTALAVFACLERTISALPTTITELIDAKVSAARIQEHLNAEERAEIPSSGNLVEFRDASVAWPSSSPSPQDFELREINLRFPTDELSVIHGKTGTGKSLLLAAIIGEADITSGSVLIPQAPPMNLRGSETVSDDDWLIPTAMAYVSQVPWIENTTVKEAILFGLPYREHRYRQVLHACALQDDIKILPDGEDTEIGATGINLSGGQRWRLTLARALYSRAGIMVLDDIFSAVDSHVGKHILEHAILGPLGEKRTRILVTHHTGLVERHAAYLVELKDRTIAKTTQKEPEKLVQIAGSSKDGSVEGPAQNENGEIANVVKAAPRKFVQDETREVGRVKFRVYKTYINCSGGRWHWFSIFVLFVAGGVATVARSWWLALWTETYTVDESTMMENMNANQHGLLFYLGIYLLTSFISIALVAVKITVVLLAALRASRHLFQLLTGKVLRAPLRWLDTEPTGRVLNRFVGDFAMIDTQLGGSLVWCMSGVFSLLTIIAAALFVSFAMIIPIIVLTILSLTIVYLYMDGTRDIKRLESTAKSPIFELVGSTLLGLTTIRCFGRTEDYMSRMYKYIDRYAQTSWYMLLASCWMALRQGLVGMLFALFIAVGVVYFDAINASLAGFALSFALDFSSTVQMTIGRYTAAELSMNATERVLEYAELGTEKLTGDEAASAWPSEGNIAVRDLEVGYAKDLESVLKGISFSVNARQRIGIVGRTGSGKSSLTLALFRFLEARKGSIEIDGVDISTLKLHDLRSRLAIIPQDPVLFSGTLRSNLDPFNEHSDLQLLEALERVDPAKSTPLESRSGPITHRSSIINGLSSPISRGGSNLSQGEKQLICLARAILTRPKILVLDEATSAVDMETDALIQRSIREQFSHASLLVVAHRLSTVADFDKILVMSDGRVVEFDSPEALAKKKGMFWKMMQDSGEKQALKHLLQ